MSKRSAIAAERQKCYQGTYEFVHFADYDYTKLNNIMYITRAGRGAQLRYADCFIMADTESSKSLHRLDNHICAWTISVRAFHVNIVTLYGTRPGEFVDALSRIRESIDCDCMLVYVHNLAWDIFFLRKFLFQRFGYPVSQLNTKPYYPIYIGFENGIEFRDSYILAQKSLDKWANDLDVEHKKATGKWDYDLIRHQGGTFTQDELEYIEHDTLAGVECLDKTMQTLRKRVYSMPYTATGIPRNEVRKRGRDYRAHDRFLRCAFSAEMQKTAEEHVYHGGYTHGNRHAINWIWEDVSAYDFASSYPYCLLAFRYPAGRFEKIDNQPASYILKYADNNAFIFKLVMIGVEIKDGVDMPALQYSKCVSTVNAALDNGRVLYADYIEIWLTEMDLQLIVEQYDCEKSACIDVYVTRKEYLPRWFTDYIYELFEAKTRLKGGDPVEYSIAKAKLNSLYGMCCQRPVRQLIVEDYETGEYHIEENDFEEEYDKYLRKYTSILPYQYGIWCTAYAMRNLFELGRCAGHWLYSDTDSCYGQEWDTAAVERYNEHCRELLRKNGYGPVHHNGRDYWLGIAEFDGHYKEFKFTGAKRYACRNDDGSLKITVAGVPKKTGARCLDSLDDFREGFIFSGEITGKKTHRHIIVDEIYTDEDGNECGDSIDLEPCDYKLSNAIIDNMDRFFSDDVEIQIYE